MSKKEERQDGTNRRDKLVDVNLTIWILNINGLNYNYKEEIPVWICKKHPCVLCLMHIKLQSIDRLKLNRWKSYTNLNHKKAK